MKLNRQKIILLIIAFGVSFLLYGNSLGGDFVSDDKLVILQNPLVSGDFGDFFKAFSTPYYYNQPHAGLYRPLTTATYNVSSIFSSDPLGFHLVNILLNAVNGILVFVVALKLFNKKTAYLSMLVFMFLPIHSEAVSAVVGRAELLSFLFSILSLIMVLNRRYALASIFLLLGLLSKETSVGIFLVFLYIWKFRDNQTLKQVIAKSLYFVPAIAVYFLMRFSVLGKYFAGVDHLMAYNPLRFAPFLDSIWTSLKVFYLYISKTFVPYQLSSDYSFNQIPIITNPFIHHEFYASVIILASIVFLIFKKRKSPYGISAVIFILTFLLVSNWFVKIGTIMGERLMYTPSLGLAMLLGVAINDLTERYKLRFLKLNIIYILLGVLFVWYGYVIIDRNKDWRTETSIITSGYNSSPNSVVSITNMAFLDFNSKDYEGAAQWSETALQILPDHLPALFLGGHAYKNQGELKKAESYWFKVAELNPNYTPVYLSLGILYYETGQLEKAELALKKGFELEKTWGKAFPLALVKINLGKYDESIRLITDNFGTTPARRELNFALGLAYLKKGDKQKAEFYLTQFKNPSETIEDYFRKVINQNVFKISEY